VANECPPPNPIGQQRIERMTINENQIGKSRSDRFQHLRSKRGRFLSAGSMPHSGMATIDHRCRPWMAAHSLLEINRSPANVPSDQIVYIPTAGAEQSNNVSCSPARRRCNFPAPCYQTVVDDRAGCLELLEQFRSRYSKRLAQRRSRCRDFLARGCPRQFDEFQHCRHLRPMIQARSRLRKTPFLPRGLS
jgi:hypothetical protein